MKLNVNYKEVHRIGKFTDSKAVDLNRRINELIVLIDNLSYCWSGEDSETFIKNSTKYLKERKQEVLEIRQVASAIKKSSNLYGTKDVEWKEIVKREEEFENV